MKDKSDAFFCGLDNEVVDSGVVDVVDEDLESEVRIIPPYVFAKRVWGALGRRESRIFVDWEKDNDNKVFPDRRESF